MTLDASTLSRNLQPLADSGWLEVVPGDDARSRLVRITEAGRRKRAEAQPRWRAAQEALNDALGPQRVIALHALIDESLACLSE